MNLTPEQDFEIERLSRDIDAERDIDALRRICKETLYAWQAERSRTNAIIRQSFQP